MRTNINHFCDHSNNFAWVEAMQSEPLGGLIQHLKFFASRLNLFEICLTDISDLQVPHIEKGWWKPAMYKQQKVY